MNKLSLAEKNLKVNALLMDAKDNVVTCVADIAKGEAIVYKNGTALCSLIATENIPYCHKATLCDIAPDADIIKYGESLGKTTAAISRGSWVADHNLVSVPRDYASEMIKF